MPNPNPGSLWIRMDGPAEELQLKIYDRAMIVVASVSTGPVAEGWVAVPLPESFVHGASNGLYFCRLISRRTGSPNSKPYLGKILVLR
jgi:hypothetical protein